MIDTLDCIAKKNRLKNKIQLTHNAAHVMYLRWNAPDIESVSCFSYIYLFKIQSILACLNCLLFAQNDGALRDAIAAIIIIPSFQRNLWICSLGFVACSQMYSWKKVEYFFLEGGRETGDTGNAYTKRSGEIMNALSVWSFQKDVVAYMCSPNIRM